MHKMGMTVFLMRVHTFIEGKRAERSNKQPERYHGAPQRAKVGKRRPLTGRFVSLGPFLVWKGQIEKVKKKEEVNAFILCFI